MKLINNNPCSIVNRPKKEKFSPSFYSEDEVNLLLKAIKGDIIEIPVKLAVYYGFRRSDILGLKWSAMDFQSGYFTIKHTVTCATVEGVFQLIKEDMTQSISSKRTLKLTKGFKAELQQHIKWHKDNQSFCRNKYDFSDDAYVFCDETGKLMRPDRLSNRFRTILRYIRFHDLRHTYASILLNNKVHMKEMMGLAQT